MEKKLMKTDIRFSWQGLRLSRSASQKYCFMLIALLFFASGCAKLNENRVAGLFSSEQNLIHVAYKIAEDLEKQAFPPLQPRHPEQPILTTTFVNNNDLGQTSHFSRVLQEHLTSRFVQMGYTVREVKFRNELQVEPLSGEKMLSRNLQDIRQSQTAQAISVGTYSLADKTIYLSARLVDPVNANIVSSVDYKLVLDKNMQAMFGLQPRQHELVDPIDEPRHSLMTRLLY